MKAIEIACEVCKAEVGAGCDPSIAGQFINSFHQKRVNAAGKITREINKKARDRSLQLKAQRS